MNLLNLQISQIMLESHQLLIQGLMQLRLDGDKILLKQFFDLLPSKALFSAQPGIGTLSW